MLDPRYFVYILVSKSGTLYTGVTNDIHRRVQEHKSGKGGFSSKYNINRLVYYEEFQYIEDAIVREKQIKSWRRDKKRDLIKEVNSKWTDLSDGWFDNT